MRWQVGVGGGEVLLVEPGPVGGKVRAGFGDMRQKRVGQKDDLLLGFARIHRMDGEQVRCQFTGFRFTRFADGDAGIDTGEPVVEPGRDLDDLPAVGADETPVGGQ